MSKKYQLKRGKLRCALEDGAVLELTMRQPSLPERMRYEPLRGRAGHDMHLFAISLQPYADYDVEQADYLERLEAGEEDLIAPNVPTTPIHRLDPELWEQMGEAVPQLVAEARVIDGEESYSVAPADRAELIAYLSAVDLLNAARAAFEGQDLTAAEKNC